MIAQKCKDGFASNAQCAHRIKRFNDSDSARRLVTILPTWSIRDSICQAGHEPTPYALFLILRIYSLPFHISIRLFIYLLSLALHCSLSLLVYNLKPACILQKSIDPIYRSLDSRHQLSLPFAFPLKLVRTRAIPVVQ
ncbi:hypothetical protein BDR05DRAFT_432990 [Suillus weaverae]|nr:hypothetical protein BDR05DRAFT_432990 [Suillus weaverae]